MASNIARATLGVLFQKLFERLGSAELFQNRLDQRILLLALGLAEGEQKNKEAQKQRHHIAERQNPIWYAGWWIFCGHSHD